MKTKDTKDTYIPLLEAVRIVREKHPEIPVSSLRAAVTQGRISYMRTGPTIKARYLVRVDDLRDYCESLIVKRAKPQSIGAR